MRRRFLTVLLVGALGLLTAGASLALAGPGDEDCCCVIKDSQIVCTQTGQVLETCCCK